LTTSSSFLYYSHTRFFLRIVVSIIIHIAPSFALVPYTTLFRSRVAVGVHSVSEELGEVALPHHGDDQEHESNTGDQQDRLDHLRSEEHTSELQSRFDLVCRLLLEKKKTYPRDLNELSDNHSRSS